MAKSRGKTKADERKLLAELEDVKSEVTQMFEALRTGAISEDEFKQWWQARVAFKGRGFLRSMLERRELARGWDTKRSKSS